MNYYSVSWIAVQIVHALLLAYIIACWRWKGLPYRRAGLALGVSLLPMQALCGFNCPLTLLSDWLLTQAGDPTDTRLVKHSFVVDALGTVGVPVPVSLVIVATVVISAISFCMFRQQCQEEIAQ